MIAADVLQRSFLTSAEKELVWLVGRVEQAGLYTPEPITPLDTEHTGEEVEEGTGSTMRQSAIISTGIPEIPIQYLCPASALPDPEMAFPATPKSYPESVTQARQALLRSSIPPLQALAQRFLLHSLSTTALTSTLSALLYVSISTTSIYESGTIAALGLVFSMRRLQKRWEAARKSWEMGIWEKGRSILRDEERRWGKIIETGGQNRGNDVALDDIKRAKEAVARVKGAVAEIGAQATTPKA